MTEPTPNREMFTYTRSLSKIYETLASQELAKKTPGGMWYAIGGVSIYQDGASHEEKRRAQADGADSYLIKVEHPDVEYRNALTDRLEELFQEYAFVSVGAPDDPVRIGPRTAKRRPLSP